MVVPFDDHMVHRGHGVFDTAHVCDGRCHLLDRHLARFARSMRSAKLNPPAGQSLASMRATILATIAASGLRDAQARYYAGAGPGGFALSHDECVDATFYVTVVAGRAAPDPNVGVSVVTSDVPIKPPAFARRSPTWMAYLRNLPARAGITTPGSWATRRCSASHVTRLIPATSPGRRHSSICWADIRR